MLHALRDRLGVREQIQPLQIVRPQPGPLKQLVAVNNHGKTLRTADSDIETIAVEQELRPARRVFTPGRGHGKDRDLRNGLDFLQ